MLVYSPRGLPTVSAQKTCGTNDEAKIEGAQDLTTTIQRPQVQQQLTNRVLLAFLDVARSVAEADCKEERAEAAAEAAAEPQSA